MAKPELRPLFIELAECGKSNDWVRALTVIEKIFMEDPNNVKALQSKVVALIRLQSFDDALEIIGSMDANQQKELFYEKAYCLYRSNKPQETIEILRESKDDSQKVKELMAQSLYLMEEYQESYTTYLDVIKNSMDENDAKREANLAAVIAALRVSGVTISGNIPGLSVDVDSLDWSLTPKTKFSKKNPKKSADADEGIIKKKKRKRKRVLPKNYDATVDPDPERWLPRWQRSSAGRKKVDKRKAAQSVGKGTQGAACDPSETVSKASPKPGSMNPQNLPQGPRKASAGPAPARKKKPSGKGKSGRK